MPRALLTGSAKSRWCLAWMGDGIGLGCARRKFANEAARCKFEVRTELIYQTNLSNVCDMAPPSPCQPLRSPQGMISKRSPAGGNENSPFCGAAQKVLRKTEHPIERFEWTSGHVGDAHQCDALFVSTSNLSLRSPIWACRTDAKKNIMRLVSNGSHNLTSFRSSLEFIFPIRNFMGGSK